MCIDAVQREVPAVCCKVRSLVQYLELSLTLNNVLFLANVLPVGCS